MRQYSFWKFLTHKAGPYNNRTGEIFRGSNPGTVEEKIEIWKGHMATEYGKQARGRQGEFTLYTRELWPLIPDTKSELDRAAILKKLQGLLAAEKARPAVDQNFVDSLEFVIEKF